LIVIFVIGAGLPTLSPSRSHLLFDCRFECTVYASPPSPLYHLMIVACCC